MAKCNYCNENIIFITTERGKQMPCNTELILFWATPKAAGKIVTKSGKVLSCNFEGSPNEFTGVGYVPHFATCVEYKREQKRTNPPQKPISS